MQNGIESYYAHGKLLLSGEYLVLSGAKALALPLKYGQKLTIKPNKSCFLSWEATMPGGNWFQVEFNETLEVIKTDKTKLAQKLADILRTCVTYRPDILELFRNKAITTHLEFDKDWGWGSSSTLISLLSQWLGVHPYHLLQDTFGGSGYDIACSTATSPIIYQLINDAPKVEKVEFNPSFSNHIYFVYSGNKQNSQKEIARFDKSHIDLESIKQINSITEEMLCCRHLNHFGQLIEEHEKAIGQIVQLNPVKIEHFNDFKGYIKTLGAWGGDFMMVVSEESELYIRNYFESKSLNTIFKYNDIKIS
ncbi:GYDIA family GHMP kinase [Carboxylicivirga marina]|uniref:GYDIA family GHMP kinase n=1 Tax=Carboxylicivirga marina TaxID=2800988 RepID=UPI00259ACE9E|nr:GYDIA family GHMP kinase [uncultured Carboxylicivirga sp.]